MIGTDSRVRIRNKCCRGSIDDGGQVAGKTGGRGAEEGQIFPPAMTRGRKQESALRAAGGSEKITSGPHSGGDKTRYYGPKFVPRWRWAKQEVRRVKEFLRREAFHVIPLKIVKYGAPRPH
jgi:hypothetical protein